MHYFTSFVFRSDVVYLVHNIFNIGESVGLFTFSPVICDFSKKDPDFLIDAAPL